MIKVTYSEPSGGTAMKLPNGDFRIAEHTWSCDICGESVLETELELHTAMDCLKEFAVRGSVHYVGKGEATIFWTNEDTLNCGGDQLDWARKAKRLALLINAEWHDHVDIGEVDGALFYREKENLKYGTLWDWLGLSALQAIWRSYDELRWNKAKPFNALYRAIRVARIGRF